MARFHHFGVWEEWYDRQTGRVYCTRRRQFVARPRWVRHSDGSANTALLLAIKFGEVSLAEKLMARNRGVECVIEDVGGKSYPFVELYTREPIDSEYGTEADGTSGDDAATAEARAPDLAGGGGDYAAVHGAAGHSGGGVGASGASRAGARFEKAPPDSRPHPRRIRPLRASL